MVVARLPQMLWRGLIHPLGEFIIYAEHTELPRRVEEVFTNEAGTFGIFPQAQLGGETETGGVSASSTPICSAMAKSCTLSTSSRTPIANERSALRDGNRFVVVRGISSCRQTGSRPNSDDATVNGLLGTQRARFRGPLRIGDDDLFTFDRLDLTGRLGWRSHAGPAGGLHRRLTLQLQGGFALRELTTDLPFIPDVRG